MPTFSFLENPDVSELEALARLYRRAGWWEAAPQQLETLARMVRGSHCFLVARRRRLIVGMARAISDGVSDAYVQDVTVAEAHRHRGIGRALVKHLVARLRADGLQWIGLIAERGTRDLYLPLGFTPMPEATPLLMVF